MVNWGFWCYSLLIGFTHQVFGDLLVEIVVIRTPINMVHGSFISIHMLHTHTRTHASDELLMMTTTTTTIPAFGYGWAKCFV